MYCNALLPYASDVINIIKSLKITRNATCFNILKSVLSHFSIKKISVQTKKNIEAECCVCTDMGIHMCECVHKLICA